MNLVATPISASFFFSLVHKMLKTYFFELLPADFTDLPETWHTASVDPPDKKLSKDFIEHLVFELLNNNFLQIWFQTGSVAYLNNSVFGWHET